MSHHIRSPHAILRVVLLLIGLCLTTSSTNAQNEVRKLVSIPAPGKISSYQISNDGTYVVYIADANDDEIYELYSLPISGGTPVKLNRPMITGGDVTSFIISPDNSRVVYKADQEENGTYELYSVPIDGPAEEGIKLNKALPDEGNTYAYEISTDSSRVIYIAEQDQVRTIGDGIFELYSVSIAGPASEGIKLNHPLRLEVNVCGDHNFADNVSAFKISPDNQQVIYKATYYQSCNAVNEVFSVPIDGPSSEVIKLNPKLVVNGDVLEFKISSNSARVVYSADQDVDEQIELFSISITGLPAEAVKLNNNLVSGDDVTSFLINPDSNIVVYGIDGNTYYEDLLYSVPISGPESNNIMIAGPSTTARNKFHLISSKLSPDGSWVIYQANTHEGSNLRELYSVPITGPITASAKLNPDFPLTYDGVSFGTYWISPDSSRVVYDAGEDYPFLEDLYGVPINGPMSENVNLTKDFEKTEDDEFTDISITLDSLWVVFKNIQYQDGFIYSLNRVPINGPSADYEKLNHPLAKSERIKNYQISTDGRYIIYAVSEIMDIRELYVVEFEEESPLLNIFLPLILH